jgi:hypothetical protein
MSKYKVVLRLLGKRIEALPLKQRILFEKILNLVFIWRTLSYRNKFRQLQSEQGPSVFSVDKNKGYQNFTIPEEMTQELVNFAKKTLSNYESTSRQALNKKEYLQQIWNIGMTNAENNFVLNFALQTGILKAVGQYFNSFPILHDISIFYSPPSPASNEKNWTGSQLFHRDGAGTRCMKLWLLCDEVNSSNGPTTLLPAAISDRKCEETKYVPGKKFETDDLLFDVLQNKIELTGKTGSWFATDTDRCLHYGSRTKTESSRLVMMFHYVDLNSVYYLPFVRKHYFKKYNPISVENLNCPELALKAISSRV